MRTARAERECSSAQTSARLILSLKGAIHLSFFRLHILLVVPFEERRQHVERPNEFIVTVRQRLIFSVKFAYIESVLAFFIDDNINLFFKITFSASLFINAASSIFFFTVSHIGSISDCKPGGSYMYCHEIRVLDKFACPPP